MRGLAESQMGDVRDSLLNDERNRLWHTLSLLCELDGSELQVATSIHERMMSAAASRVLARFTHFRHQHSGPECPLSGQLLREVTIPTAAQGKAQ